MSFTCIPKPCSCGITQQERDVRKGYTHPKNAPCPFAVHDFPVTRRGTCCSLKASVARWHLYAFGEDVLAQHIDDPMTAERALVFAEDLRRAMDRLEVRYQGGQPKPATAWNVWYWNRDKTTFVWKRRATFEEAVAAIRQAADWFEIVGRLGYGVAVK